MAIKAWATVSMYYCGKQQTNHLVTQSESNDESSSNGLTAAAGFLFTDDKDDDKDVDEEELNGSLSSNGLLMDWGADEPNGSNADDDDNDGDWAGLDDEDDDDDDYGDIRIMQSSITLSLPDHINNEIAIVVFFKKVPGPGGDPGIFW